jgi:hypothetical protein
MITFIYIYQGAVESYRLGSGDAEEYRQALVSAGINFYKLDCK